MERAEVAPCKVIVVSHGPEPALAGHVAALDGFRRALCLPLEPEPPEALRSFVELWGEEHALRAAVAGWPFPARAWLVSEHLPLDYQRSWPSGTPSPGVRMLGRLFRRPGTTRAEFEAHWLGPHARVARSYTVPAWRYSQNVVVEALSEHDGEDGFVGMHFRTPEQLASRWADHPEEAARGAADAALFMDVSRAQTVRARETVWDPRDPGGG